MKQAIALVALLLSSISAMAEEKGTYEAINASAVAILGSTATWVNGDEVTHVVRSLDGLLV